MNVTGCSASEHVTDELHDFHALGEHVLHRELTRRIFDELLVQQRVFFKILADLALGDFLGNLLGLAAGLGFLGRLVLNLLHHIGGHILLLDANGRGNVGDHVHADAAEEFGVGGAAFDLDDRAALAIVMNV